MSDDISRTVKESLKDVFDPELGYNVVDLGFVYGLEVEDGHVRILLTTTMPGCPAAAFIRQAVEARAAAVAEVRSVDVTMTWQPPWSPDRMSDAAKAHFGVAATRSTKEGHIPV